MLASYHWIEGKDSVQALTLLTDHAEDIISSGQADDLLKLLSKIDQADLDLSTEQSAAKYPIIGDALRLTGEYAKALEAYDVRCDGSRRKNAPNCFIGSVVHTAYAVTPCKRHKS